MEKNRLNININAIHQGKILGGTKQRSKKKRIQNKRFSVKKSYTSSSLK